MQLFINGKEISLSADERVAITLQQNDLADVSKPNTSYTNKFKILKNADNIAAMEFLGVAGFTSRMPYRLNNVNLLEDSILLIQNGFCEIVDSDSKYYNINVYGSEKEFFEKIKGYTLQDVYPDENVTWNVNNLFHYTSGTTTFCFPIAQYSNASYHSNFVQQNNPFTRCSSLEMSPNFFVRNLFKNIFLHVGYTFELPTSVTTDPVYNNLIVPSQKGVRANGVVYGQPFNVKNCVPRLDCITLIKEIMWRYGLVMQVNQSRKKVIFFKLSELITSSEIVDWSDKFSELKSEIYSIGNYGQTNIFEYADDEADENIPEFYPANLLRGIFQLDNETLPNEKTVITSAIKKGKICKQEELTGNTGVKGVVFLDFNSGQIVTGDFLFDLFETTVSDEGQISNRDIPTYLMHLTTRNDIINFGIMDNFGFYTTRDIVAKVATNENISFQDFINNHYQGLINVLNTPMLVKCKMNLNLLDIHNLDFNKRYYIKQLHSHFYLNKIKNWENGKEVEVELIRIPPTND